MTTDLTLRTLRLTRGPNAPKWIAPETLNLDAAIATSAAPMIGIVQSPDKQRIAGRFFPAVKVDGRTGMVARTARPTSFRTEPLILVFDHEDPQVTRATVIHELCHWLSYMNACGRIPQTKMEASRCKYVGEHSPAFYERLEGLYRACNVPLYAARMVEGEYPYPEHWNFEGVNEAAWPPMVTT